MKIRYFKLGVLTTALAAFTAMFVACDRDIEVGAKIDEKPYEAVRENNGFLRDANTNKASNIVELFGDTYETALKMGLTKAAVSTVKGTAAFDAAYLAIYNKEHGTDFELYPAELVSFAEGGALSFTAGSFDSSVVSLTVTAGSTLEENKTYAIPVTITLTDKSISLKEKARHCIYLVKDRRNLADCFKGEDLPKGYLFFEVNDTNPLNALSFQLENGKLLWDVVVLFAANINYNAEEQRPYVQCNSNVQYLLDNNEIFIQPLRKRGVKVLLGLLGNGDQAGLAQLSEQGAKDFAQEIASYCKMYNLDGVNYDDEYSKAPDLSNPAFTNKSTAAGARLSYETKKAMPDKLVTIFIWGSMYGTAKVDDVDADEWIDIAVANYGSKANPIGAMTRKKCSGASMEFHLGIGANLNAIAAQGLINDGYGWFMGFASDPKKYAVEFARLTGCETLYGSQIAAPTVFYKKNDPIPYRYPEDYGVE